MKLSFGAAVAATTLSFALASPALARTAPSNGMFVSATGAASSITLDMTGWSSWGEFGAANNTTIFLDVDPGTQITGFTYDGLSFATNGGSWLSEMVLSVNNSDATSWLDWAPSTTGAPGTFGPASGAWGGDSGAEGPFGAGGAFTSTDGVIILTVYESFDDPFGDGGATLDASISGGTLTIMLTPIPEPGTYGMMALGLLAVGAAMRKRQMQA